MARTINSTLTSSVELVTGGTDNPLLITGTGAILPTGGDGIDADAGTVWTITNRGKIVPAGLWGIFLTGSGTVINSGLITGFAAIRDPFGVPITVTNNTGGTLSGIQFGIDAGSATVINAGLITAALYDGVYISGSLVNRQGGVISGFDNGVLISGPVTNGGTITGTYGGVTDIGNSGAASVTVTNQKAGVINGGVFITGYASNTVVNAGAISSQKSGYGAFIYGDGLVTNAGSGSIVTNRVGVGISGVGTVINQGVISGGASSFGVTIGGAGTVTNSDGGTISGGTDGITITGAGTVINSGRGTIAGAAVSGVAIGGGGTVVNRDGATISGPRYGVSIAGVATVTNGAGSAILSSGYPSAAIRIGSGSISNAGTIGTIAGPPGQYAPFGIYASGSATITNEASGVINTGTGSSGFGNIGIDVRGTATVTNLGTILASYFDGIAADGGVVINRGLIGSTGNLNHYYGVSLLGTTGTVNNTGSILGGVLLSIGTVTNGKGGFMGGDHGVVLSSGTVTNEGTISEIDGANTVTIRNSGTIGNVVVGAGTITNQTGGAITGTVYVGAGTITNQTGSTLNVVSVNQGVITNQAGGTISSVLMSGANDTITNAGTILGVSGNGFCVALDGSNSRLIIDPGAVFGADVLSEGGTIELAKGSGTISGGISPDNPSSELYNFASLAVDPGGNWTLSNGNTIASVTDNGHLTVAGSLHITTAVDPTSTGVFQLGTAGVLEVAAATGISTKMSFTAGSELIVDYVANFGQNIGSTSYDGPLLEQFGAGASIDLKDFAYGTGVFSMSFNAATGVLALSNSASQAADLDFQKSTLGAGTFHLAKDAGTGVLLTRA